MKKNLGVKNWMFPMPVLMIGTYGVDGTPDVMNAAWGGITLEDEITICIDTSHKTWANIAARKAFTVRLSRHRERQQDAGQGCEERPYRHEERVRRCAGRQRAAACPRVQTRFDERGELQCGGQDC